ncbi:hypothetical protein [Bacillus sp. Marseille-P3661]|uniref:hypothetical protein n=1 Tax=Bacillus sp. Marseille-P3661 TaxID=1936234 RepID=UPI0015E1B075|nr:hypothetical protein [Bacillus sp. Marseille-P3661]
MEELLRQLLSGQEDIKNDIKQIKSDLTEIKTAVHRIPAKSASRYNCVIRSDE